MTITFIRSTLRNKNQKYVGRLVNDKVEKDSENTQQKLKRKDNYKTAVKKQLGMQKSE